MFLRTIGSLILLSAVSVANTDPGDWSGETIPQPVEPPLQPTIPTTPGIIKQLPGAPGLGFIEVNPTVPTEIPFRAMIQQPAPIELFWYIPINGETKLCARLPIPLTPTQLGYVGNCFGAADLAKVPKVHQPAAKSDELSP